MTSSSEPSETPGSSCSGCPAGRTAGSSPLGPGSPSSCSGPCTGCPAGVRFLADVVRRGHTGPRRDLVRIVVPMVLGPLDLQLGWTADQLRATRSGHDTTSRDHLAAPSGVRRWVTTDGERVLTLSFNGVPSPPYRDRLLESLRSAGVPVAFFVTGADGRARADDVTAVASAGHSVGMSGWGGSSFPSLPDAELQAELDTTGATLKDLVGRPIRHVRPPGGTYDRRVVSTLDARGLETWLWTNPPCSGSVRATAARMSRRPWTR
jgi:Polysaccharide deacetylase